MRTNALIAGIGAPGDLSGRFLALDQGKLAFGAGRENKLSGSAAIESDRWHFIAVTYDGTDAALYSDGNQVDRKAVAIPAAAPTLQMAPEELPPGREHFAGKIAGFTVTSSALSLEEILALHSRIPNFDVVEFEDCHKHSAAVDSSGVERMGDSRGLASFSSAKCCSRRTPGFTNSVSNQRLA
jgi:hypothetical protein